MSGGNSEAYKNNVQLEFILFLLLSVLLSLVFLFAMSVLSPLVFGILLPVVLVFFIEEVVSHGLKRRRASPSREDIEIPDDPLPYLTPVVVNSQNPGQTISPIS